MSVSRACQPCRTAKAKCNLVRPSCSRCERRGLDCAGYSVDDGFVFLDENETAQRNSERARRTARTNQRDILPILMTREQQTNAVTGSSDIFFRQHYTWLSQYGLGEVPNTLKRDLETRAVERFFINWVLHPRNDGMSPGYMHDLPMLYLSASPASVLWLIIRAMAFADMRNARADAVPFNISARQHYGACLARMREITNDDERLLDDNVLAALLFIDCFELIYLGRDWKHRPHDHAIRHVLRARGQARLFDKTGLALWSAAHHRLQAHQIVSREEPDPELTVWLAKLNTNQTDMHLSADLLQINILSAAANKLTNSEEEPTVITPQKMEESRQLHQSIEDLIQSMAGWTSGVNEIWRPNNIDLGQFENATEMSNPRSYAIPSSVYPTMLSYGDLWLAYLWNLHAASQIVLRESLVDIIKYRTRLDEQALSPETVHRICREQEAVEKLSSTVMQSFPILMGFKERQPHEPRWSQHGKMAGRYFCIFTMWIVSQSKLTPPAHKEKAIKILEWIDLSYTLS